jgi:hypothetical protein
MNMLQHTCNNFATILQRCLGVRKCRGCVKTLKDYLPTVGQSGRSYEGILLSAVHIRAAPHHG